MNIFEKSFSQTLLQDLKNNLLAIKNGPSTSELIDKLISTIDAYEQKNTINHPEIIKELRTFYDSLSPLGADDKVKSICDVTKKCCRECMFHMDDCFINIIFLIFESVKINTYLEPNKIRPTLRMDATRITINQMTESIKAKSQDLPSK